MAAERRSEAVPGGTSTIAYGSLFCASAGSCINITGGSGTVQFVSTPLTQFGGRVVSVSGKTGGSVTFDAATTLSGSSGTTDAIVLSGQQWRNDLVCRRAFARDQRRERTRLRREWRRHDHGNRRGVHDFDDEFGGDRCAECDDRRQRIDVPERLGEWRGHRHSLEQYRRRRLHDLRFRHDPGQRRHGSIVHGERRRYPQRHERDAEEHEFQWQWHRRILPPRRSAATSSPATTTVPAIAMRTSR
jgi:hypothetical protein